VGMGELLHEWNDINAARRYLYEGIELAKQEWAVGILRAGYFNLERVLWASVEVEGVLALMQSALQRSRDYRAPQMGARLRACQARLWLAQNDVKAATRWARDSGLSVRDETNYLNELEHIVLARVFIVGRDPYSVWGLLERMLQLAQAEERTRSVIELLVL
jgi:hypothetical protein